MVVGFTLGDRTSNPRIPNPGSRIPIPGSYGSEYTNSALPAAIATYCLPFTP